jgi:hypothetical protein
MISEDVKLPKLLVRYEKRKPSIIALKEDQIIFPILSTSKSFRRGNLAEATEEVT